MIRCTYCGERARYAQRKKRDGKPVLLASCEMCVERMEQDLHRLNAFPSALPMTVGEEWVRLIG